MSGFAVVSGPFAVGESRQDPIAYATNPQIEPRPYEPSLAITLSAVAARNSTAPVSEVADGEDADREIAVEAADMRTLVLAHPADAVARAACESIRQQLSIVGIPVRLRELAPDELATSAVDYDLLYAELMLWEPLVDSRVLLGEDGMTGKGSSYMDLALRKVDSATSWAQVRSQLQYVHRVAHNDVAVIPLWQTVNFFAYRKSLKNVGDSPVSLYQNIERWDIASAEQ